eukprot:jgi/Phyca11/119372/e_gw1.38.193.1
MPTEPKHRLAAWTRVRDALKAGRDWMLVADCNGIPATTACNIVDRGTQEAERGIASGVHQEEALIEYVEENCLSDAGDAALRTSECASARP